MSVNWPFGHAEEPTPLLALYAKGKRGQWDAAERLDWSVEVDPAGPLLGDEFVFDRLPFFRRLTRTQRDTFTAHATAHRLAQSVHGEHGALLTAAAVVQRAPEHAARLCAATQVADEARHVEVFLRYTRKLGLSYPVSPWLRTLIDGALGADHVAKQLIAMNIIVESLAHAMLHNLRRRAGCPLLRELAALVLVDEARHVAFGQIYLRQLLADMHADDREDMAEFAFTTTAELVAAAGGVDGRRLRRPDPGFLLVLERAGIEPRDFIRGQGDATDLAGLGDRVEALRDLILPALLRVGAITPRARARFHAAGFPLPDAPAPTDLVELDLLASPGDAPPG